MCLRLQKGGHCVPCNYYKKLPQKSIQQVPFSDQETWNPHISPASRLVCISQKSKACMLYSQQWYAVPSLVSFYLLGVSVFSRALLSLSSVLRGQVLASCLIPQFSWMEQVRSCPDMIKLDVNVHFQSVGVCACMCVMVHKREPRAAEHTQPLQPCGYGIPAEGQTCFSLAHARLHAHMSFPHACPDPTLKLLFEHQHQKAPETHTHALPLMKVLVPVNSNYWSQPSIAIFGNTLTLTNLTTRSSFVHNLMLSYIWLFSLNGMEIKETLTVFPATALGRQVELTVWMDATNNRSHRLCINELLPSVAELQ